MTQSTMPRVTINDAATPKREARGGPTSKVEEWPTYVPQHKTQWFSIKKM